VIYPNISSKDSVPILTRLRRLPMFKSFRPGRAWLYHSVSKIFWRVKEDQVLILSDSRAELSGNLEFIARELNENYPEFHVVTALRKSLNSGRTFRETWELPFLIATSRFIVLDDYYPYIYRLKVRKGVNVIQAWHAAGAFKRVGYSRMGLPGGPSEDSISHRGYTDAIVSSESIRGDYAEAFRMPVEKVHAIGIPRSDVFFDEEYVQSARSRVREHYKIPEEKRVILYAPTFRGNGQRSATFDFEMIDWNKLGTAVSNDFAFLVKMHPFVRRYPPELAENPTFINVSENREINDLLFAADVLITDYSSVIFEYALLNRPTIFHVPDLALFQMSRDFYYPFDDYLFGPQTTTTDALIAAIAKSEVDEAKLDAFTQYFMSACDGASTERFVRELIVKRSAVPVIRHPLAPTSTAP
jgi:CDP-glycerol glycerophosphotransferase (TagB/SpsB family)